MLSCFEKYSRKSNLRKCSVLASYFRCRFGTHFTRWLNLSRGGVWRFDRWRFDRNGSIPSRRMIHRRAYLLDLSSYLLWISAHYSNNGCTSDSHCLLHLHSGCDGAVGVIISLLWLGRDGCTHRRTCYLLLFSNRERSVLPRPTHHSSSASPRPPTPLTFCLPGWHSGGV